jgi:hypothetical protein
VFSPDGEQVWIKRYRVFYVKKKPTILEFIGEYRPGKAWKMAERMIEDEASLFKLLPLNRTFGLEFQIGLWYRVYVDPRTRTRLAYPQAKDRGFAWLRRMQLLSEGGENLGPE